MAKVKGKRLFGSILLAALLLPLPAAANTVVLSGSADRGDIPPGQEVLAPTQLPSTQPSTQPEGTEPSPSPRPYEGELPLLLPASALTEAVYAQAEPAAATLARTAPVMTAKEPAGDHAAYLSGTEDGLFHPDRTVSRLEFARKLAPVVTDLPERVTVLYDVPWSDGEAAAVQKAVGLGLLEAPNGFFRPNDPITHAECALALAELLPFGVQGSPFYSDVPEDHPAYDAISRVGSGGYGLFPDDGSQTFAPEETLKLWELAVILNRVSGRTPDHTFLSQLPAFETFSDVPADHPGFWDILEATIPHACGADDMGIERWLWADVKMLEEGPRRIAGRLYWVQNGAFLRDQYMGYLYFDSYGRYTTGSAELDTRLNNIIEKLTNDTMTRDQKLRALFNYCRDYYTYLKRPLISKGQTGWEPDYALFFLRNGKGNCYCFSAAYCLLCRNLGLQAYTVVGRALNSPHGWVEIKLDGNTYLFDTQLEWRYLHDWGMRGYNFFKQPYYGTTVVYTR